MARGFDALATSYDQGFGQSPTGRLFRFRFAERVLTGLPAGSRILDVGCGTGEDALWLAAQGHSVHGIDASAAMIEVARAKAVRSVSTATFECVSVSSMAAPDSRPDSRYDVVISNFGALNCVPLAMWTARLGHLLVPSGRAFVSLMGRAPLPESLGTPGRAPTRGPETQTSVGGTFVPVHYGAMKDVRAALSGVGRVNHIEALGCLVPGPQYDGFARRHPILVGALAMAESVLRGLPWIRGRGDHTLFEVSIP